MSVAGVLWDPQGLQTVGIILLLCSSLKLLHALGIIDLSRGGGMGMGLGLQWDGIVWWSCSSPPVPGTAGRLGGIWVCFGGFVCVCVWLLGCVRVSGGIRV